MNPSYPVADGTERSPVAVLQEAQGARIALDQALQGIVRLLDRVPETDGAEQEYWSLCDEHQRLLALAELPPDLRAALELRQKQRAELQALFAAYREAEQRWKAARRQLNHLFYRATG